MAEFQPEEFEELFASDVDDWDDWQMESVLSEAIFRAEDARESEASAGETEWTPELMQALYDAFGEDETWIEDSEVFAIEGTAFFDEEW